MKNLSVSEFAAALLVTAIASVLVYGTVEHVRIYGIDTRSLELASAAAAAGGLAGFLASSRRFRAARLVAIVFGLFWIVLTLVSLGKS